MILNYYSQNDKKINESTLISFVNLEDNKDLIKVFIRNLELIIFIKEEWRTGIFLSPFKFYLINIIHQEPSKNSKNRSKVI